MKKQYLLTTIAVLLITTISKAQVVTIHPEALRLQLENSAMKTSKNALYTNVIEQVDEIKQDILKAKGVIEEAHRLTYKALTEVKTSISEAKKLYYTLQAIQRIEEDLQEAYSLALGIKVFDRNQQVVTGSVSPGGGVVYDTTYVPIWKNPILPLHYRYNSIILEQCVGLAGFINQFVIRQQTGQGIGSTNGQFLEKSANIVSNIIREKFLSSVYQKVHALELTTKSYVFGIRTVKWQADSQNIIPWQLFINDSKAIVTSIISRLNF